MVKEGMSTTPVARRRNRTALTIVLLLAFAIGGGVLLRVRALQREMLTRWRAVLTGGAITTQRTVDEWVVERRADATELATTVSLHSVTRAESSGTTFAHVLAPVVRRGKFVGIWVLDSAGRVIMRSTPDSLREQEKLAVLKARAANDVVHSEVIALGPHAAFLSFAVPIAGTAGAGAPRPPPAVAVLRTDVVSSFSPWASGRPNAAMSLLSTPVRGGAVIISACPEQAVPVCIAYEPNLPHDAPAALALARADTFGVFSSFDGPPILASTRFDADLGWGVVRRVRFRDATLPLWREIAIEGAFLTVLLALLGVAAYAANRNVRVKRLSEQREAAGRLASVLDAATDGIISLEEDLTIRMVNGAIERLLGHSRESLVGRSVLTLFTARWHAPLSESLRAFGRTAQSHPPLADTERCVAICADGRQILVDARVGSAMVDGVPLYVMGLRDVSDRARAEAFLQGQRQVLELIATGAPTDVTMTKLLGVLEGEASQLRSAVYEIDDEWQVARLVASRALPDEFTEAYAEIAVGPGVGGGVVGSAIFRRETILSPDVSSDAVWGDDRAFLLSHGIRGAWAVPLRAAEGRIIGALACFYDEPRPATPREREVARTAVHLASVALSSARASASLQASTVRLSEQLAAVSGGRRGLEQIVTNLVMNAVYAAGRSSQVWVGTRTVEGGCEITVEDSAPSIPEDLLPRILVKQLGGRIAVDPAVAGRGVRFTVFLPGTDVGTMTSRDEDGPTGHDADAPVTKAADAGAIAPVVGEVPKAALIIDDEPTIRAALRRYFTRRGWTVEEAADGAAGLALIESHGNDFGVVISDLRMPGFSGIELHDRLASANPEMLRRFVFSTGDVASGEAASFVQRTKCPVLQKPFELRMLDSIIARVTQGTPAERVIT